MSDPKTLNAKTPGVGEDILAGPFLPHPFGDYGIRAPYDVGEALRLHASREVSAALEYLECRRLAEEHARTFDFPVVRYRDPYKEQVVYLEVPVSAGLREDALKIVALLRRGTPPGMETTLETLWAQTALAELTAQEDP